jgi:membrane-bound metal-dependent hydrolase YbcI (DUF457 family)
VILVEFASTLFYTIYKTQKYPQEVAMAQAGIHGMIAAAVRKYVPGKEWLMLGIVLGNIFPDMDNIAVAVATVAKLPTHGLHRTFTHSVFTIVLAVVFFYLVAALTQKPRWKNLGLGLGIGILMHVLVDLVIWFNGVEILWPLHSWVNLWEGFQVPDWLSKFLMPAEFLCFGLFFLVLASLAHKHQTDTGYLSKLRVWTILQFVLFAVFTVMVYTMEKGFMTIYGAVYLLSLFLAFGIVIRMRNTVEALG